MSSKKPKKDSKNLMDQWSQSRLAVFLNATWMTIASVFIFAGTGYWLDQVLGTFPAIFITGLVVAFPLTQIMIYKKFRSFANKKVKEVKKDG